MVYIAYSGPGGIALHHPTKLMTRLGLGRPIGALNTPNGPNPMLFYTIL